MMNDEKTKRKRIIEAELRQLYIAFNKTFPHNYEFLDIALEDLAEIPTYALKSSIRRARKTCETATPPNNAKILKAFASGQGGSKSSWIRCVKEAMQRRIDYPEGETPERLQEARDIINGVIPEVDL